MSPRRTTSALLVTAALLAPARALAEPRDATAASALFQAGRQAMDAKDFASACPKFAESYRLDPAVGTLLNLANCEEKVGRLADASTHFRSVLEQLPPKDDRAPIATTHLAAIAPRLAHLTLVVEPDQPAGIEVTRDDVPLGAAALGVAIDVNAGDHDVVVTAPGRDAARTHLTLKEGERRELALHAGAAAGSSTSAGSDAPRTGSSAGTRRTLGFVIGGVGIAGLGAGAITGILTLGKASTVKDPAHCTAALRCDPTGVDAARAGQTLAVVSTATLLAGAAAAATGVVLIFTSRTQAPETAGFMVSPSGAGLQIGRAW